MNFDNNNDFKKTTVINQPKETRQQTFTDQTTLVMPRELLERAKKDRLNAENVLPAAVVRRRTRRQTLPTDNTKETYNQKRPVLRAVHKNHRQTHYLRWLLIILLVIGSMTAGYIISNTLNEEKQALENRAQTELQTIERQKRELEQQPTLTKTAIPAPEQTEQKESAAAKPAADKSEDTVEKATGKTKAPPEAKKTTATSPPQQTTDEHTTEKSASTTPPAPAKNNNKEK